MLNHQKTFYIVYDFMVDVLHLKGAKLAIYAIIHSYTRNELVYHAGQGNLSKRIRYSRTYINKAINELVEEGLVRAISKKKHPNRETSWILYQYTTVPLEELNLDSEEEHYNKMFDVFDNNNFSL